MTERKRKNDTGGDDKDIVYEVQTTVLPSIYIKFSDGRVVDPDDIKAYHIRLALDQMDQDENIPPQGEAVLYVDIGSHRWYELEIVQINGIFGMITAFERVSASDDLPQTERKPNEKIVRLEVMLNPPLVRLPDLVNDVKIVREKKRRTTKPAKKAEGQSEGD